MSDKPTKHTIIRKFSHRDDRVQIDAQVSYDEGRVTEKTRGSYMMGGEKLGATFEGPGFGKTVTKREGVVIDVIIKAGTETQHLTLSQHGFRVLCAAVIKCLPDAPMPPSYLGAEFEVDDD